MERKNSKMRVAVIILSILTVIAFTPLMNPGADAHATSIKLSGLKSLGHLESNNGNVSFKYNDTSILNYKSKNAGRMASVLPNSYDLSSLGQVTSVKDQRSFGTCWAFASIGAMESSLIKQGYASDSIDLSERHLAYFTYHGADKGDRSKYAGADTFAGTSTDSNIDGNASDMYNEGGYADQAIATLARGYGAVKESVAPYISVNTPFSSTDMEAVSTSLKNKQSYGVSETRLFDDPANEDGTLNTVAMKSIKRALMNYGACSISYFEDHEYIDEEEGTEMTHPYYNVAHRAYYCSTGEADHAVTLVGWQDSFPKEYFGGTKGEQPPGNGAWLVKGSYGSRLSSTGYYWISYYTPSITEITSYSANKVTYKHLYQYDGVGTGYDKYVVPNKISGANVYKARTSEKVKAVGTWTPAAACTINVKIYKNVKSGKPTSGTKLIDKTFTRAYTGYHTLKLGKSLKVAKGQKFSVVIRTYYKDGGNTEYFMPFETYNTADNYVTVKDQKKGESYIYIDNKWEDTRGDNGLLDNDGNGIGNALAKVYAD